MMPPDKLRSLALDLNQTAPRSPYAPLGASFPAVAARLVDKCRAELLGRAGSYHYNCPMDRRFFAATGLEPAALRDFISTGADDVGGGELDACACQSAARADSRLESPLPRESPLAAA